MGLRRGLPLGRCDHDLDHQLLVPFGTAHPLGVSASPIFAPRVHREDAFFLFLMALAMVAVLRVIRWNAVALLRRIAAGP